ncbi:hypothetical protein BHM03_00008447, partial [Ensete ventricosum]
RGAREEAEGDKQLLKVPGNGEHLLVSVEAREPTGKMLVGEGGDHLPAGCLQGWPPTAKLLIWAIACGHGLACRPLQGRRSSAGVIARGQQCPPAKAEATMPTHRGGRRGVVSGSLGVEVVSSSSGGMSSATDVKDYWALEIMKSYVVNFKALRGMPCVPFATRAAPPPTQEELVEAPEVRPHEGGDTYSKKKPKLGVHKVFRSITARVDCGTKEGHGGDGSGARSPRGKEHVMVTVANPTVGKTPVHGR